MLFDLHTIDYVGRVAAAFQSGQLGPVDQANVTCAECGRTFTHVVPAGEDSDHVLVQFVSQNDTPADATHGMMLMVIGCEGYWHINPEVVDLPRGAWQAPDAGITD